MTKLTAEQKENLSEAAQKLEIAMGEMAEAIRRAGGRDSDAGSVRYFASYHLADLEGQDAGWLGSRFMIEDLREMIAADFGDEDEEELEFDSRCESGWTGDRCQLPLGHEGPHDNA